MKGYEERLDQDGVWALREGGMYFEGESSVHKALRKIAARLEGLNIPYALVGGMALFLHGYRRFTENVDLLVSPESLQALHRHLEGQGYLPPFPGSRHLRDTELGVKIEFLVAGDFPGDGRPKPVAFPDPGENFETIVGLRCLPLLKIIELKLASGMTNPARLNDLADVQKLIQTLALPDLSGELNPYVRAKFSELWQAVLNDPWEHG